MKASLNKENHESEVPKAAALKLNEETCRCGLIMAFRRQSPHLPWTRSH